jgi:hypothetical protein
MVIFDRRACIGTRENDNNPTLYRNIWAIQESGSVEKAYVVLAHGAQKKESAPRSHTD